MTTSMKSTIHAELGWIWQDQAGATTITNSSRLRSVKDLDDGHGVNQADAVWDVANQSLAAGGSATFALDALERTLFGDTIYVSLLKVKAILIVNKNTSGSGYLLLGGASSNEWYAPFAAAGDKLKIMTGGTLLMAAPRDGWSVTTSAKNLKIAAVTDAIAFDIAILGTRTADSSSSSSLSL